MTEHAKDGRLRIDPSCEFDHRWQAMECPSCAKRVTGEVPSPEWWSWYRRRYQKRGKNDG
jgi:hypothetical protein